MSRILVFIIALFAQTVAADDVRDVGPATSVGNGSMQIFRNGGDVPETVVIHFHGATPTLKKAFARYEREAVLVTINFPGLSSAYSMPFAKDRELFGKILEETHSVVTGKDAGQWKCVYVSSFSAGYGAVREILKTPLYFEQIKGIVMADSIYAGLDSRAPKRVVNEGNMRDFVRFASLATKNRKAFILSHSAQPTPYASTTETADYLLSSLNLTRTPHTSLPTDVWRQSTQAERGKFIVLGFKGESGQDHMQHLKRIDRFWNLLPRGEFIVKR